MPNATNRMQARASRPGGPLHRRRARGALAREAHTGVPPPPASSLSLPRPNKGACPVLAHLGAPCAVLAEDLSAELFLRNPNDEAHPIFSVEGDEARRGPLRPQGHAQVQGEAPAPLCYPV